MQLNVNQIVLVNGRRETVRSVPHTSSGFFTTVRTNPKDGGQEWSTYPFQRDDAGNMEFFGNEIEIVGTDEPVKSDLPATLVDDMIEPEEPPTTYTVHGGGSAVLEVGTGDQSAVEASDD